MNVPIDFQCWRQNRLRKLVDHFRGFVKGVWEPSNDTFNVNEKEPIMCIVYNTAHNHYVVHFMQRLIFCSVTSLLFLQIGKKYFLIWLRKKLGLVGFTNFLNPHPASIDMMWYMICHDVHSFHMYYKIQHFTPFTTLLTYKSWFNLYSNIYLE